eukprot:14370783-Alexandrium_andersonii.AAC.1
MKLTQKSAPLGAWVFWPPEPPPPPPTPRPRSALAVALALDLARDLARVFFGLAGAGAAGPVSSPMGPWADAR